MEIRKAIERDRNQLVQMRIAYLREDYGVLTRQQVSQLEHELPEYFSKHIGDEIIIYIAEDNGEMIATAFLLVVVKPANPSFMKGKTGTILNVYTKPNYRKQGIAEKLMRLVIKEAQNMDLNFVELKATKAGVSLYKKIGFVIEKSEYTQMKYSL